MTNETPSKVVEWPDEIWAEDPDGSPQGLYRFSVFATVDQPLEHAKYVHGNIHSTLKRYYEAKVAELRSDFADMADDRDRTARNRDMWAEQCKRQAETISKLREITTTRNPDGLYVLPNYLRTILTDALGGPLVVGHCDEYIDGHLQQPECLRAFLRHARLPAHGSGAGPAPKLFATRADGKRVRVVMASRLGDVGISTNLQGDNSYSQRVLLSELTLFSERP